MIYLSLNWAHYDFVFEHERNRYEYKVQQKHGETESLVHFPSEARYGHYYEEQHHEEYRNGTHHSHRVHLYGLAVDDSVYQPRHW